MAINWRALFDEIRIQWRDRGPNTSKGNISVCCPWCGNDPSFHLSVAEAREAYYCYRDPNRHSGRSAISLLIALGVPRADTARLLNRHSTLLLQEESIPRDKAAEASSVARSWAHFVPAHTLDKAASYIKARGFPNVEKFCRQFDIRVAEEGTWANRVLIPYYHEGRLDTWTGRALYPHMVPKYLMHQNAHDMGLVYIPSKLSYPSRKLILVEGQFDALKLAYALPEDEYLVVALGGLFLNASKLLRIIDVLGSRCGHALLALDKGVPLTTVQPIRSELASYLRIAYIGRATLPSHAKDPADLSLPEIPEWVNAQFSRRI